MSQEKDRRTLILLLLTRMTNSELVLGKLFASLLNIFFMLAAAVPVFMLTTLFGGVSFAQVVRVFAVTIASALVAGSLGSTLAFWREKTFQTLSITALVLVMWLGHLGVGSASAWAMRSWPASTDVPGRPCSVRFTPSWPPLIRPWIPGPARTG